MTYDRVAKMHDNAWAEYMAAFHKVRAIRGRGAFRAQQRFLEASEKVARAQYRLFEVER